jgi:ferrous iron transport protein B
MSTLAIVKRETNSWKWPLVMFGYMTVLAYLSAWITFEWANTFLLG